MGDSERLSREKVRLVRSLARRRERRRRGLYLLEGMRLVAETAEEGSLAFVYGTAEALESLRSAGHPGPFFEVDPTDELFLTENAQGVGAVARIGTAGADELLAGDNPLLLLDRIADPGNLGTILRAADWFGMRDLLLTPGTVDPWNPKCVRATMGGILRCRIAVDVDPDRLAHTDRPIIGLTVDGEALLGAYRPPRRSIVVVGSEAEGISARLASLCTATLRIPGRGGESLNAAMATTLLLWELFRSDQTTAPVDPEV